MNKAGEDDGEDLIKKNRGLFNVDFLNASCHTFFYNINGLKNLTVTAWLFINGR